MDDANFFLKFVDSEGLSHTLTTKECDDLVVQKMNQSRQNRRRQQMNYSGKKPLLLRLINAKSLFSRAHNKYNTGTNFHSTILKFVITKWLRRAMIGLDSTTQG